MKLKLMIEKLDKVYINDVNVDLIKKIVGPVDFQPIHVCQKYTYMTLVPCGFDIEAWKDNMYIWTCTIRNTTVIGYTWEDFTNLLNTIAKALDLGKHIKDVIKHRDGTIEYVETAPYVMPIMIHNYKYEYAFMMHQYDMESFFIDEKEHNPLYSIYDDSFVFIDSYKLYPMKLAEVAKAYTKTQKAVGDLDHTVEHTVDDAKNFTEKELNYCICDTKILSELASYTYRTYVETLGRLPLTQNMIVRYIIEDEYNKMNISDEDKKKIKNLTLSQKEYWFVRYEGFRGGYCASSCCDEKGRICYGDETSAYMTAIIHGYYPMEKYRDCLILPKTEKEIDEKAKKYCCQMKIKFYNIRCKGDKRVKYESKRNVVRYMPDGSKPRTNKNGTVIAEDSKVLKATIKTNEQGKIWKAGCISVSITEIDWDIYKKVYEWDRIEVLKFETAKRGPLPDYIKLAAIKLYEKKAKLKKAGKTHCSDYISAKTLVSNIFGCIVKKLDKDLITGDEKKYLATQLDNILKPQWGVYVTAHARSILVNMILSLDADTWLYSDTDSIYYIWTENNERIIKYYNHIMKIKNKQMCNLYGLDYELFDDLGCWDDDSVKIKRFKSLGAKAYLYITEDNKYKLVLAGIPEEYFWASYDKKYSIRDEKHIFDFFEKETTIEYHRSKLDYTDKGCIIKDDTITGPLGHITEIVAATKQESTDRV